MSTPRSDAARQQSLFADALELPPEQRDAFLERECADDPTLLAQMRALLESDARHSDRTVPPIIEGMREILLGDPASLCGLRVGPYVLREELGRGGMGVVYRAERDDGEVKQSVAVKLMRRELADAESIRRFRLEREFLARLSHPSIARLFDAARLPDGMPYYVMEFVEGAPLTEFASRAGLDVEARVALVRRVCNAVAAAHRGLIVHRDLKPSNVLVEADGTPKLLDFGIAKQLSDDDLSSQTGTAQRYFSPRYAAPEQVLGAPIGVACDVYGLGLLLYELLAGTPPFDLDGKSAGQVERLITEVPPEAPSTFASRSSDPAVRARARALRGELDDIVLRCLRKAPEERYPSVEQLEADLANYLEGRPVAARGGHAWYRMRKFVGRHRVPVAIGVAAAIALATAAGALVRQNAALIRERDRSRAAVDFMKDAFTAADPSRAAGADVTARKILEGAQPKLDALYESQPELFASLGGTIADVEFSLGMSPKAAPLAGRSVEAARRAGLDAETRRELLILEAKAYNVAGKPEAAAAPLAEAERMGAANSAEWLVTKARVVATVANPKDALPLLDRALALVANRPPTEQLPTSVRWQIGETYRLDHELAAARDTYDKTLAWQRPLPPGHPLVLQTRLRRLDVLYMLRDGSAVAEAQAVLGEVDRIYGSRSTFSGLAKNALASALQNAGRLDDAIATYRLAVETWREAVGVDHPATLRTMFNFAEALSNSPQKRAECIATFRTLVEVSTRRLGSLDPQAMFFRAYFGQVLADQGDAQGSLEVLGAPEVLAAGPNAAGDNAQDYALLIQRAHGEACVKQAKPIDEALCARSADWISQNPLLKGRGS